MFCPKCGLEQPEGTSECVRCGIIFAKWGSRPSMEVRPAQAQAVVPVPTSAWTEPVPPAELEPRGFPILPAVALIGVLVLGTFAKTVFFPRGHPVAEGAYRNEAHQFAVNTPGDWILMTPENYKEIMARLGDRLPSNLQGVMDPGGVAAGFIRLEEGQSYAPSMNITPVKGLMPPLRQKDVQEITSLIVTQLKTLFGDYTLHSSDIVKVDKLESLRILGTATLKIRQEVVVEEPPTFSESPEFQFPVESKPATRMVWASVPLTCMQFLVPGGRESYVLTCTSRTDDFKSLEPVFNGIVDSFRVLRRPPPYGPVATGAVKGSLLAAIGYLAIYAVYGFARRIFNL